MAEPGYDRNDNMFDRFGAAIFGNKRPGTVWIEPEKKGEPPSGGAQAAQAPRRDPPTEAIKTAPPTDGSSRPPPSGGNRGQANEDGTQYKDDDREGAINWAETTPGNVGGSRTDRRPMTTEPPPRGISPPFAGEEARADESGSGVTPVANVPGSDGAIVQHEDEGGVKITPASKVTPGGKGGGGGRGGGTGKRKLLGDQTRTEAYDPTLDANDPRNIGVIDTQGNVNKQAYAASPMAHPEAYPKGTDQFTPGGQTSQTIDQRDPGTATKGAIRGALDWIGNQFHQNTPDQHTNEGYAALTKGAVGAPDDDTMRSVFAVVDPKNELDYKHRMELATKTGYDWYMHNGQPEKAKKFAAEALQYGNKQAQSYGDQAMKDMQNGDRASAIAHLKVGYGWMPDGYHADPTPDGKTLEIHDGKGKVVQTIPLDDKSVQNLATGMATGTLFYDVMQHRAGIEKPFKPQAPQPTQAVVTQSPQPGGQPAPAVAPASAPGATPVAAAPGAAPAPAGAPPPVATPPVAPPPPPPQQAAAQPPAAAPGPTPAPAAPPTQAITPTAPPVMGPPAPVQPSTTKRPIVDGQPSPMPTEAQPAVPPSTQQTGATQKPAETKPAETKPAETKPAEKPVDVVRDPNDPDQIATKLTDGTEIGTHRQNPLSTTKEEVAARVALQKAEREHKEDLKILAQQTKNLAKNPDRQHKLALYGKAIEEKYKDATAEARKTIDRYDARRDAADKVEQEDLKPRILRGTEMTTAQTDINGVLNDRIEKKENWPIWQNSPLRLDPDPKSDTYKDMSDIALSLMAYNKGMTARQAAELSTTLTAHVEDDEAAKHATMNGGKGRTASRFWVGPEDLNHNAVVVIGTGNSQKALHMPKDTLNDIKRLKLASYDDFDKKRTAAKKKADADAAATKREQDLAVKSGASPTGSRPTMGITSDPMAGTGSTDETPNPWDKDPRLQKKQ